MSGEPPDALGAVQRMAAKLRPRVMLPRAVWSTTAGAAEARGRQLQRRVGRHSSLRSLPLLDHAKGGLQDDKVFAVAEFYQELDLW